MRKELEVRYVATDAVSVPIYKVYSKTAAYKEATKAGWGILYYNDKDEIICDEDCSASIYTKNGCYFGIYPDEKIKTREIPKQAECAAIIISDSCGLTFWAENFELVHIFVTWDKNGLIDSYRIEYGGSPMYDDEVEILFDDLKVDV